MGEDMTTSDKVRMLCGAKHISVAELARRIGQSSQNLNAKLRRETLSREELYQIAESVGCQYEEHFILEDGTKI